MSSYKNHIKATLHAPKPDKIQQQGGSKFYEKAKKKPVKKAKKK